MKSADYFFSNPANRMSDKCHRISLTEVITALIRQRLKILTALSVQVGFSEPLSFLQRLTEDLEYADCLDAAAALDDDSCLQLAYVTAFAVSSYASTTERIARPFNPLLGETFECNRTADLGWKSIAEKVRQSLHDVFRKRHYLSFSCITHRKINQSE